MPKAGIYPKVKITQLKRFLFESSLKRQSAIINIDDGSTRNGQNKIVCKGAPEVIEKYLKKVPEGYTEHYINFVKDGARVLALAHRDLRMQSNEAALMTREETEKDLEFCGFIISVCPMKEDTKGVIEELVYSNHEVKMITGDNQLTAAFVAQELNFAPNS
jgi:manganese-transporting P-type ATPase